MACRPPGRHLQFNLKLAIKRAPAGSCSLQTNAKELMSSHNALPSPEQRPGRWSDQSAEDTETGYLCRGRNRFAQRPITASRSNRGSAKMRQNRSTEQLTRASAEYSLCGSLTDTDPDAVAGITPIAVTGRPKNVLLQMEHSDTIIILLEVSGLPASKSANE
jgi:hypothetical protein